MGASSGNRNIIRDSINRGGAYGSSGVLSKKDAEKFVDMITDDSTFLGLLDKEIVDRKDGKISKLGVGSRLLRNHEEGEDGITGNEVVPVIGDVPYSCKYMTLGTSLTEDWIEQNQEKGNFEQHFMGQIAEQIKLDILDLSFNGDETVDISDKDHDFLMLNDGFIKQIKAGGNIVDGAAIDGGKFSKKCFYALRRAVPKKYRNQNFRWICSDDTYTDLCEYLSDRATSLGDISITQGKEFSILQTGFHTVPNFPDDLIIYADPKNLKVIYFVQVSHRKTTEGKEAIYRRKRFYATHVSLDFIIKEIGAVGMLINRGEL